MIALGHACVIALIVMVYCGAALAASLLLPQTDAGQARAIAEMIITGVGAAWGVLFVGYR